jgi:hypothetical protein
MERAPTDVHAAPPAAAPADMSTTVDFLQEYPGALTPSNEVSERATAGASGSPERKHAPPRSPEEGSEGMMDGCPTQPLTPPLRVGVLSLRTPGLHPVEVGLAAPASIRSVSDSASFF